MKSGLLILMAFFMLLTGCNRRTETDKASPPEEKSFNLASLPQDWVMLTPKGNGYVVYNSCDSGNPLLTLSHDKATTTLLLHGQQEDYEFEVLKAYTGSNDTIVLKAKWKGAEQLQDFKFIWKDKAKKLGRWITTYDTGHIADQVFVPANLQNQYPVVNQPCRECWGDECDEMENDSITADSLK